MKLNKFLVAAAAVAVLPLSVANAEEPTSAKGPALVNEKAPYAEKGTSLVNEKPEFKLSDLQKPAKPAPAKPVKKVLPKTHAVK